MSCLKQFSQRKEACGLKKLPIASTKRGVATDGGKKVLNTFVCIREKKTVVSIESVGRRQAEVQPQLCFRLPHVGYCCPTSLKLLGYEAFSYLKALR